MRYVFFNNIRITVFHNIQFYIKKTRSDSDWGGSEPDFLVTAVINTKASSMFNCTASANIFPKNIFNFKNNSHFLFVTFI